MNARLSAQHVHILERTSRKTGGKRRRPSGKQHSHIKNSQLYSDADYGLRWLYALILAIDANFKLSLKEKGIENDPALGDGWAHWVPREDFIEYLREHGGAVEVCYLLHLRSLWN